MTLPSYPLPCYREFVAAIFDVGLKCASPKTILAMMKSTRELTAEHIKSHLQKYRLHREKAREEFLRTYGRSRDNPSRIEAEQEARLAELKSEGANPLLSCLGSSRLAQGPLTPVSLITECLQMQLGFQNMLKQALLSQQEMQSQLQTHLQALGMTADTATSGRTATVSGGGQAAYPVASEPSTQATVPPPSSSSSSSMPTVSHQYQQHQQFQGGDMQQQSTQQLASTTTGGWEDGGSGVPEGATDHSHLKSGVSGKQGAHNHHHHHHHHGEESSTHSNSGMAIGSLRAKKTTELQMEAEMRSHMDMHRQLLIRKKDQVSQYSAGELSTNAGPPQVGGPHTMELDVDLSSFKWNDECLDEDLFNFLRGDDSGIP